jgi:hypothetical protein
MSEKVTYEDCRDSLESGDLVFFSHYKWASLYDAQVMLVRLFSFTEYTHVGVVVKIAGRVFIAESVSPLARLVPLSNFAKDGFYIVPTRTPMQDVEMEYLMSHIGKGKYSKWQAILAYLDKLEIGADDVLECAEYVITARRLSGLDLGGRATPAAVLKEALNKGLRLYYVQD